jgi:hypothetical protein
MPQVHYLDNVWACENCHRLSPKEFFTCQLCGAALWPEEVEYSIRDEQLSFASSVINPKQTLAAKKNVKSN